MTPLLVSVFNDLTQGISLTFEIDGEIRGDLLSI